MNNKRSGWITVVVVLQFVYVLLLLVLPIYLMFLAGKFGVRNGFRPTEETKGLTIAAAIVGFPGFFALVGWLGLWRKKLWGWWLSVATDLGLVAMFVYSLIDDGWKDIDWDVVVLTGITLVPVIGLLLPRVKRFYWGSGGSSAAPPVVVVPR
jgi:hypothetical protein